MTAQKFLIGFDLLKNWDRVEHYLALSTGLFKRTKIIKLEFDLPALYSRCCY